MMQDRAMGVTIEAKYSIGEYDILILSAEESGGLETWLKQNGYALPENAKEVLQPYIKDKLKFFVVKVNLENSRNTGYNYLRPIQITYESDRFMLPIRLGMANSRGFQDLIVYAFTKSGRVECTNYRTEKMPTDNHIPTFVLNQFDSFYIKAFNKQYIRHNKNAVFLEYAWNVTPSFNGVKCDPCVGNPPMLSEFQEAGVSWLNGNPNASVFFTRMHVRYSRAEFPQDLMFQVTPNTENFQARYVITHPATDCNCSEGREYLQKLETRKVMEVIEYCRLTGDKAKNYVWYAPALKALDKDLGTRSSPAIISTSNDTDVLNRMEERANTSLGALEEPKGTKWQIEPLLLLLFPLSLLLYALIQKKKVEL
ncbi:MAG: DUF2330 domain-containing protein [bacterium]|nr:DUF2330 domain-containing protein [bacterium]